MAASNNNRPLAHSVLGESGKIDFEQFKRYLSNKKMRQEQQRDILIQKKVMQRILKEKGSKRKKRSNKKRL